MCSMYLRKLKQADAPLMLEWMHDDNVVHYMRKNFRERTLDNCIAFIRGSEEDPDNLNLAVADENDIYQGTVSLKHIVRGKCAEFAICMRTSAMGKGFSGYAMKEIMRIGFEELGLKEIYWSVNPESARAVRFYEKNGFRQTDFTRLCSPEGYTEEELARLHWYQAVRESSH